MTAGAGGRSYLNFQKVPSHLADFCKEMNERRQKLIGKFDEMEAYILSFDAHNELVAIHPWVDGNGRMSRLMMNYIQMEFNLITTKVCKEDKAEYIQSLIDSREEESLLPFQLFMLREHTQNLQSEIDTFKASMAKG